MSLFLIYFDVGKPVPPSSPPAGMSTIPMTVRFKGRAGPARQAFALTDGVSSGRFLRFGNKMADREGEALRRTLADWLKHRLNAGAHPHIIFIWFDGPLQSATIDIDAKVSIPLSRLSEKLKEAVRDEVIEITDQ
jgi:hypothetical protein